MEYLVTMLLFMLIVLLSLEQSAIAEITGKLPQSTLLYITQFKYYVLIRLSHFIYSIIIDYTHSQNLPSLQQV